VGPSRPRRRSRSAARQQGTTAATPHERSRVYPWVRAGDTITIGTGASAETRTVSSITGATIYNLAAATPAVGAAGERAHRGRQDRGGDPGLRPPQRAEPGDAGGRGRVRRHEHLHRRPGGRAVRLPGRHARRLDVLRRRGHFSDEGHSRLAAYFLRVATPHMTSFKSLAKAAQPDRLAFVDSFYTQITFANSWSSYTPSRRSSPRARTRRRSASARTSSRAASGSAARSRTRRSRTPRRSSRRCRSATGRRPTRTSGIGPYRLQIRATGDVLFPDGVVQVAYLPLDNIMFEAGG
jgi:hypothetical protein